MLVRERQIKAKKFKRYPISELCTNTCHVVAKKDMGLVYIQKMIWVKFENEDYFQALPPTHLHRTLRRSPEVRQWLDYCKALEFEPNQISDDPEIVATLLKAGYHRKVADCHGAPEGMVWKLEQNDLEPTFSNQIFSLEQDTFLFGGDTTSGKESNDEE